MTAAAAERRLATALASLLAIAAGALTVAAYAPFGAPGLAVVTLALLFGLWFGEGRPRAAARTGLAFGIGLFGAGISWVYIALETFGGMAAPLAALATGGLVLFLSLYPALAGFVAVRLTPAGTTRRAIAAAAAFVLAEWLRGFLFTGFPWLAVGYSQLPGSPLSGYAPVGGLVVRAFGRLPKRGETTTIDGLRFRVIRADSRRVHTLQVERIEAPAGEAPAAT